MATPAPGWRTVEEQAASAWKPVEETPPEQPGILKQYWDKVNPANIAQGIAHSVVDLAHGGPEWRESNQQLYNRAIESFKKGDTDWRHNVEGVRFIGPQIPGGHLVWDDGRYVEVPAWSVCKFNPFPQAEATAADRECAAFIGSMLAGPLEQAS